MALQRTLFDAAVRNTRIKQKVVDAVARVMCDDWSVQRASAEYGLHTSAVGRGVSRVREVLFDSLGQMTELDTDLVWRFLSERCDVEPGAMALGGLLRAQFLKWCPPDRGLSPPGFGGVMRRLGFAAVQKPDSKKVWYLGLRIKDEAWAGPPITMPELEQAMEGRPVVRPAKARERAVATPAPAVPEGVPGVTAMGWVATAFVDPAADPVARDRALTGRK